MDKYNMNNPDNLERALKFAQGIINLSELADIFKDPDTIPTSGDNLTNYMNWICELSKDPENNSDIMIDQMHRVIPKLTKMVKAYIETCNALGDEIGGNHSDIFEFDDSYFDVNGADDDK